MGEYPIMISNINDFIFCPVSIFFHSLDSGTERLTFQDVVQLNGTAAHENSDNGNYSDRKDMLQSITVYCEKYNLMGKIDTFDCRSGVLTERKKHISTIYDGYVFQLYAQYFALTEMGYAVKLLKLYSMDDNKSYKIELPIDDIEMYSKFEDTLESMSIFDVNTFYQDNVQKCDRCIYEELCCYSCLK